MILCSTNQTSISNPMYNIVVWTLVNSVTISLYNVCECIKKSSLANESLKKNSLRLLETTWFVCMLKGYYGYDSLLHIRSISLDIIGGKTTYFHAIRSN